MDKCSDQANIVRILPVHMTTDTVYVGWSKQLNSGNRNIRHNCMQSKGTSFTEEWHQKELDIVWIQWTHYIWGPRFICKDVRYLGEGEKTLHWSLTAGWCKEDSKWDVVYGLLLEIWRWLSRLFLWTLVLVLLQPKDVHYQNWVNMVAKKRERSLLIFFFSPRRERDALPL